MRKEFFLDQADFDFYDRIRRLGFMTVFYNEKLMEHRLGIPILIKLMVPIPLVGRVFDIYEPPWRSIT